MKLTKIQFLEIRRFVEKNVYDNDIWHQLYHIEHTEKLSRVLARKEGADMNKCRVIAWLHDIAKRKEKENKDHGNEGARMSAIFLRNIDFLAKDIEEICYAIRNHNKGGDKKTIESKIIWDADKLQAIGPYGLLRAYGFHVSRGNNQDEAYKLSLKEQRFFIKRFYTETAKKIAQEKFLALEDFCSHYEEISNPNYKDI